MGFARWFRLSIGLLLVVVPLWVLLTGLDAIWNGHPAYPTTLLVTVGTGLTCIAFALWPRRRDPEASGPAWVQGVGRDAQGGNSPGGDLVKGNVAGGNLADGDAAQGAGPADPESVDGRRGGWRVIGRVVSTVVALLLLGILVWLRPFPAGPDALAALRSDALVTVVDNPTSIELIPTTLATPAVGLVFSPGARVDSRAYAALLRPAAEAGYLVIILKEPFGLSITQPGQSAGPIADHPEISHWAVGGHSLGGVTAAGFASGHLDTVDGLLLWASYPNNDLSDDATLRVESIYGTNDLLATTDDIYLSKDKLPPDGIFTAIDGGVHAFFADYGEQPGDGQPTVSRDSAAQQISSASTEFLGRLAARPSTG